MEQNTNQTDTQIKPTKRILTAMFPDRQSLENAYNSLYERGYTEKEINIIMSSDTRAKHFADDTPDSSIGSKVLEGAGTGSAIGGTIGAVTGVIAALATSFVIPGLGILIAGPIIAGLAGAGTGIVAGGVIGSLMGAEISEEQTKLYEAGVEKGQIVLGFHPRNDQDIEYFENSWKVKPNEGTYRNNES